MDKNVSGVDLEELLKAREELDKERGVETDPNMYSDYNPNRESEQSLENSNSEEIIKNESKDEGEYSLSLENLEDKSSDNESREDFSNTTGSSFENLSKFANFSEFEINNSFSGSIAEKTENPQIDVNPVVEDEDKTESKQTNEEIQEESEADDIGSLLDELMSGATEEKKEQSNDNENDMADSINEYLATSMDIEPKFDDVEEKSISAEEDSIGDATEKEEKSSEESLEDSSHENSEESETESDSTKNLAEDYMAGLASQETKIPEIADFTVENDQTQDSQIITDYSKLQEILQNELKESELAESEKFEEIAEETKEESPFKEIEDFKFIDELTKDEFKNSDRFSYILGKNENGETVFGNFKDHYNLAVFGKKDEVIKSFLNSMILSISLKNHYHDVNFVLLDSNIDSPFEVYNKSSYLYFNRIAKTNKEILDTLIEISKEVDARYEKLANAGLKSIEAYNEFAVASGTSTLPYIFVVFNNYTSASQATDSDKIDSCLHQILKYGRIAGIYSVVTVSRLIETSQINYNLSSRLNFKSDEDSRYTVGSAGGDKLPGDSDALYFNISSGKVEHIKSAVVTDMELDLIIKDLEE